MSGTKAFFDTNVVLYLLSGEAAKADRAEALLAGCRVLWTEDLQDGQRIEERLIVSNPFAAA